jgi:hypothetical protein
MMDADTRGEAEEEGAPRLPEAQPALSSRAMARIEERLREQREDLLDGIGRLEAEPGAPVSPGGTTLAILRGELVRTTAALERLAAGAYGICEDCGAPISPLRLQIVPSAVRCDRCAASHAARRAVH